MRAISTSLGVLGVGLVLAATSGPALAQQAGGRGSPGRQSPAIKGTTDFQTTQLAFNSQDKNKPAPAPAKPATTEKTTVTTTEKTVNGDDYREVSDFFNIREANPSVVQGEWEFEVPFAWETASHEEDGFRLSPSLKYGLFENAFVELETPLVLGDGADQGNGDIHLILFYRWVRESGDIPAFATWAEMRIPSGQQSSGVDGTLHFNLTKTLADKFRGHLEGYIMTANGERGGGEFNGHNGHDDRWLFNWGWGNDERADRRHFQWGIGPGIDYQCSDKTTGILNYINRSSEEYGTHNQNILEIGLVQELAEKQHLKAAVDIGLDGNNETPNFGAKVQWSIDF